MAYNILKTNGDNLVSIDDGLADSSNSSLVLFGKNYTGYGPQLDENLVHMLENFAYSSSPQNPLEGQLWWDTTTKLMKVRKDGAWKVIGGSNPAATAPVSDVAGDLWWDTTNKQLFVWDGSDWRLTGPAYTTAQTQAGQVVSTIVDTLGNSHNIVKFFLNNTVVAVLSKDPTFSVNVVPGFSVLRPGFNLPSGSYEYVGNAENALSLGGIPAANYLRSDVASDSDYPMNILNDDGLTIGVDSDFTVKVQGNSTALMNNIEGRDMDFYVKIGGFETLALRMSGTTGRLQLANGTVDATDVADKQYVDSQDQVTNNALIDGAPSNLNTLNKLASALGDDASFASNNTAAHNLLAPKANPTFTGTVIAPTPATPANNTEVATTEFVNNKLASLATGSLEVQTLTVGTAGISPTTDGTIDAGSGISRFNTVYAVTFAGTALEAQYADLAENYVANAAIEPGTVVDFGGAYEVCENIADSSTRVAGVVSTNPAYLMNSQCEGQFVVAVALQGRCPVKVVGTVYPGALLVAAGNGCARAEENPKVGSVIGKAIKSFNGEGIGLVEVAVGRC